jgi:hypothetical protein
MVLSFSNQQAGWVVAEEAEIGDTGDYFYGYKGDPPSWSCWWSYASGGPYCGFWALIECAKVTGACCLPDESCIEGTEADCSAVSGVYQGHGTTCAQVNCAPTMGACCRPNGTCVYTTEADCASQSGTFHPQVACSGVDCTLVRYSNTIPPDYWYVDQATQFADDLTLAGSGPGYLIHYDTKVYRPPGGSYSVTAELHTGCPPTTANKIAGTAHTWSGLAAGVVHTLNFDFPPVVISGTVWLRVQFSATNVGWIIAEQAEIGSTTTFFGVTVPSWVCDAYFTNGKWGGFWANLTFGGALDGPSEPFAWVESEVPAVPPIAVAFDPGSEEPTRMLAPQPARYVPAGVPTFRADAARAGARRTRSGDVTLCLTSSVAGQTIAPGTMVDWTINAEVASAGNSGLALLSADLVQDAGNPSLVDIPPATTTGPLMAAFDRPAGITNPSPTGSAFGGTQVGAPGAMNLVQIGGSQNTFGMPGAECGLETSVTPGIGQSGPTVIAAGSFAAPHAAGSYTLRLENAVATVLNSISPPAPPAHWPVGAATMDLNDASFSFTVESVCIGDLNCDGHIDFGDINPFVLYLSNFGAWQAAFPGCNPLNGDINCDGTYGQASFGDINPFVALMGQCGVGCACPGPIACP